MNSSWNLVKIRISNSFKVYGSAFIFILLFMVINFGDYKDDMIGKNFTFNWTMYALNQSMTSGLIIPIISIMMINYLTSGFTSYQNVVLRLKSRHNVFKFNVLLVLINTFVLLGLVSLSIISIAFFGLISTGDHSVQKFSKTLNELFPSNYLTMTQFVISLVLLGLYLFFWGILMLLLNNHFKNKTSSSFIAIFLLFCQSKLYLIPNLSKLFVVISPSSHYLIHYESLINHSDLILIVLSHLAYWVIAIGIVTYGLKITYKHKQFI